MPLRAQERDEGVTPVDDAEQIDLERPTPILDGELADQPSAAHTGVVDDEVHRSASHDAASAFTSSIFVTSQRTACALPAPARTASAAAPDPFHVDVRQHEMGAAPRKLDREGTAETAPRARDDTAR